MKFSIIIPVYNRPQEIRELLESLTRQHYRNFEVLVVEDGSDVRCEDVVQKFMHWLDVQYLYKPNTGPGLSRNYGADHASGDYLIFLDSDCVIPSQYTKVVQESLAQQYADAFGGADRAAPDFSNIQKAINYSMTSFITTGGIRGGQQRLDKFYPRSFNMGYAKEVYQRTQGFSAMRFGEDIDMSIRIFRQGFRVRLIEKAYVYHKRRTDFKKFYKQVFNSGLARINLFQKYPKTLKLVHLLPAAFTLGMVALIILVLIVNWLFLSPLLLLMAFLLADAAIRNKSLTVGILAVPASLIQLTGYGCGFLYAVWNTYIIGKHKAEAFKRTFYQ